MNAAQERARLLVLVADDSESTRCTIRSYLESDNLRVITAKNGFEALGSLVQHHPSLVLLAGRMPRLTGHQVCILIKRNPEYRRTPLVLLCNSEEAMTAVDNEPTVADAYLSKPFTRDALLAVVQRFTRVDGQASPGLQSRVTESGRQKSIDAASEDRAGNSTPGGASKAGETTLSSGV